MNNIAILIGCQKYRNYAELKGVNRDIKLMKEALIKYGCCQPDNIITIQNKRNDSTQPSATQILSQIQSIAETLANKQFDNLFLYFSGHGRYKDKEPILIFADTLRGEDLVGSLTIRRIRQEMDIIKNVKNKIMFLDICLSSTPAKGVSFIPDIPQDAIIFFSCSPSQESYMQPKGRGSFFTKCLVDIFGEKPILTVRYVSDRLKSRLKKMAEKYQFQQYPQTELPDASMADIIISNYNEIMPDKDDDRPLDITKSIWLVDAEKAEGEQARFRTFTETTTVNSFIRSDSNLWGVASVKGIGKTFLLQVKRTKITKNSICFPDVIPNKSNNWGTECVEFSNEAPFQKTMGYFDLVILWRYSLVCYIVYSWLKKYNVLGIFKNKHNNSKIDYCEIKEWISKNINEDTLIHRFIWDISFEKLQVIIGTILDEPNWPHIIKKEYTVLQRLAHVILQNIKKDQKNKLVLFVDKLDQALREPTSENAIDCQFCSKNDSIMKCLDKGKYTEYCYGNGEDSCKRKAECCYGCINYSDKFAGTHMRIGSDNDIRNMHCNYWQRMQLGLVEAINMIKTDYNEYIRVFYTVRLEAFNYFEKEWGEQRRKICALICTLDYSRDEQKWIYRDCINNQDPTLLYNPALVGISGREDEAFVGVTRICHPYVIGARESVFDIVFRHSFDRSRDIQYYGQEITNRIQDIKRLEDEKQRETLVKEIIEETAAKLAYNTDVAERADDPMYYLEKMPLMPSYWADRANFETLLYLIDRNLLFADDVICICRKINKLDECDGLENCKKCKHHPFSLLYNLGMLGYIVISNNQIEHTKQIFKASESVTYIHEVDSLHFDNDTMYMVHPALTKSIEKLRNHQKILHFNGFVLGKDIAVEQKKLKSILQDKKNMGKEEFTKKYYVSYHA